MNTELINGSNNNEKRPSELQIQTLHPSLSLIFFLACFSIFLLVLHGPSTILNIIFITLNSVISWYIARFLSLRHSSLKLEGHTLQILSETRFLSVVDKETINLDLVSGYELYWSKLFKKLIIYKKAGKPYILTLTSASKDEINSFFWGRIPPICKTNHLSTRTFKQALMIGLSLLLECWFIQVGCITFYEYFHYNKYDYFFTITLQNVGKLALINLLIILFYGYIFSHLNLRLLGKHTGIFILTITFILSIAGIKSSENYTYSVTHVENVASVFKHVKSKLFAFQKTIEIEPTTLGHFTDLHRSRRSRLIKFTQYFTAPVTITRRNQQLWLGNNYSGTFSKYTRQAKRDEILEAALKKNQTRFYNDSKRKASFYEVVYSSFYPSFREVDFYRSVTSTNFGNSQVMIIKPHFESFEDYRFNLLKVILAIIAGCIAMIAIAAIVIAYHR